MAPLLILLESIYCFVSYYFETKTKLNIPLILPHLVVYPGLIMIFNEYLSLTIYRYLYWITYLFLDIGSYYIFTNASLLDKKYIYKYFYNFIVTVALLHGAYYISDTHYIKTNDDGYELIYNGIILHLFTDVSFYLFHKGFHVFLHSVHKKHHWITSSDEHNMVLVFSYADPLENAIIGTSLLIVPHLCMLTCGLTGITEILFHYQLMFVLTTHSFLFKHNHRKHHYHHDDVYGDIFTMIVSRLNIIG